MEVTINKRTTTGHLERESVSVSSQISRAAFLFAVSYTCFVSMLMLTQFVHSVMWHFIDPEEDPYASSAFLLALVCFGTLACCPFLLNNRFMESLFEEAICLTLPSFSLPTALIASLLPVPGARTVILAVGVLLSGFGFFSILCQPRTADRYAKTKLIFEVYRFAIPTGQVLLCMWRWANGGIDPSFLERYWYLKLLMGLFGYLSAFITGASYLVHDSRITPGGILADMAKDPLPSVEDYDSAADPMLSTSIGAFSWWENLLWLPTGIALGSTVFLSTFIFSSVAQICRWNGLDPYEHGLYIVLALFFGTVVRLMLTIRLRDADGLVHGVDCLLTTAVLWIGLGTFASVGGSVVGFWVVLIAVLAAASMWHHVLRLCEVRAVGAHGGLTLVVAGTCIAGFWVLSVAAVFGGALPLGERYKAGADGTCPDCSALGQLEPLHSQPFVAVALATVGGMAGPLLHAVVSATAALRARAAARARRAAEADRYVVDESAVARQGESQMLAIADKGGDQGADDEQQDYRPQLAPAQVAHVNAGPPKQQVVHPREGLGVLLAVFFVVIAPGIMGRALAHGGGPGETSALEGEFITVVSWNINFGWSTEGKPNVMDIAERLHQQQAGVVALQDANTLQWALGMTDLAGYLATELTMHLEPGLPTSESGDTGNPLMSKYPLLLSQTHVLPDASETEVMATGLSESCRKCPSAYRTITEARILVGDTPVTVLNTQLERMDGVIHAADTIARIRYIEKIANETDTPILIVGGLGIEPTSPLLDRLLRSGTGMSSAINGELLNITVAGPDRSLESFSRTENIESKTVDYILYRGMLLVGFGYVIDDGQDAEFQPSDHMPLCASFKVRGTLDG